MSRQQLRARFCFWGGLSSCHADGCLSTYLYRHRGSAPNTSHWGCYTRIHTVNTRMLRDTISPNSPQHVLAEWMEGQRIRSHVITIQQTLSSLEGAGSFRKRGLPGYKPKKPLRADGVLLPVLLLHMSGKRGSVMSSNAPEPGAEDQEDWCKGVSGERTGDRNTCSGVKQREFDTQGGQLGNLKGKNTTLRHF